jgi:hypothetical protein
VASAGGAKLILLFFVSADHFFNRISFIFSAVCGIDIPQCMFFLVCGAYAMQVFADIMLYNLL